MESFGNEPDRAAAEVALADAAIGVDDEPPDVRRAESIGWQPRTNVAASEAMASMVNGGRIIPVSPVGERSLRRRLEAERKPRDGSDSRHAFFAFGSDEK